MCIRDRGKTELSGAAIEPEIMDLINILQKMGAVISVDTCLLYTSPSPRDD